jgi:transposase
MPPKHKAKNLVERLRRDEDEVLRFMTDSDVPFKGNGVEFDLRLPTVKRQLSGNFKSIENADEFCLVRSYLLTCARNGVPPLRALMTLFQGALPDFIPVDRDEGGGAAPEAAAG